MPFENVKQRVIDVVITKRTENLIMSVNLLTSRGIRVVTYEEDFVEFRSFHATF